MIDKLVSVCRSACKPLLPGIFPGVLASLVRSISVLASLPRRPYPLAAGHSIFKVLCLSARTSLPKKEALSRISKTSEKRLKSAYFHAYGIVL
ncbi:MAG: hypothetical protein ACLT8A_09235 [Subdoligranulum sp.]|jgi:hypothetical protein